MHAIVKRRDVTANVVDKMRKVTAAVVTESTTSIVNSTIEYVK